MSINSALNAGVSGLIGNASALAAISDNIANVNTVAYKRSQVNFANVVTAQAAQGRYSAGGVQAVTKQFVSTVGTMQQSSRATDIGINGDGMFVVSTRGAGLSPSDPRAFTRQGSFDVDKDGFLKNDSGYYLLGWPARADGSFSTPPSDLGALEPINLKSLGAAVKPTQNIAVTANLDKVDLTNPEPIDVNVVDAAGGRRALRMTFTRGATANSWTMALTTSPAADGVVTPASVPVTFNTDGTINQVGGAAPSAFSPSIAWDPALGLPAQPLSLDLGKVTQYDDPSVVNQISQDGASAGNVIGVRIGEDGVVTALFDNNQERAVAKVAIATVPNPNALERISGNAYRVSVDAGELVLKPPGVGGAGAISPSSLESSTVDLSSEFTGLIQTQKAYSACSKIITTADQMLDELINIKR